MSQGATRKKSLGTTDLRNYPSFAIVGVSVYMNYDKNINFAIILRSNKFDLLSSNGYQLSGFMHGFKYMAASTGSTNCSDI